MSVDSIQEALSFSADYFCVFYLFIQLNTPGYAEDAIFYEHASRRVGRVTVSANQVPRAEPSFPLQQERDLPYHHPSASFMLSQTLKSSRDLFKS